MMCRGCGYDESSCRCGEDRSAIVPLKRTRAHFSDVTKLARVDPLAAARIARRMRGLIKHDPRSQKWKLGIRSDLAQALRAGTVAPGIR